MVIRKKRAFEDSWIYFILISLFGANFLGRGSIFCLVFGIFALLKFPRRIVIDGSAIWTLILALSAFFVSLVYYNLTEAIKSINFFLMYLVGLNGFYQSKDRLKYVKRVIFAIFLGYTLLVVLTYFGNAGTIHITGQRILKNFWTGENIAVTLLGLVSSVVIGYFFYAMWCQKRKSIKVIAGVAIIVSFLLNAQTATRTPFVLFAIVMVLMWSIYLINQKGWRAVKMIMVVSSAIIVCFVLLAVDAWGMATYIESTAIFERFMKEGTETGRWHISSVYLNHMLDYMWGGSYIYKQTGYFAHNFLQQGHDLYGICATVALIFLELAFIKNIIVLFLLKRKNEIDYLLMSMYFAMTIQTLLEPIFTGYPCFFFSLLLIHGITNGYLRKRRERI